MTEKERALLMGLTEFLCIAQGPDGRPLVGRAWRRTLNMMMEEVRDEGRERTSHAVREPSSDHDGADSVDAAGQDDGGEQPDGTLGQDDGGEQLDGALGQDDCIRERT